jgi:hypothetical protein
MKFSLFRYLLIMLLMSVPVVVSAQDLLTEQAPLDRQLARIDSVTSTATQFIMRRYKEFGVELISSEDDERGNFSL